jgi:predicted site-specific integrase-resolvase
MENFKKGQQASLILGVHQRTLYQWDKKGLIDTIRTPGNARLYNVGKFMQEKKCKEKICLNLDELDKTERLNIAYVRVSSENQKDDLMRQKEDMIKKYPNHMIIEEIGSGLNLNKRGIKKNNSFSNRRKNK